jgi:two-component system, response regulator, stage 0 sporulation protein A
MQKEGVLERFINPSYDSSFEIIISRVLVDFGIPPHIIGYQYVRDALIMLMEDKNNIFGITKNMYPEIARKYNTTPIRVERAIRHAIEISWDGCGKSTLKSYFTDSSLRPTNLDFLEFLYNWVCSANEYI